MRKRISKICVGLAAPCDPPGVEEKLLLYFTKQFKDAVSLPFVAFMTHDFQFVHGFSGGRTIEQFMADLDIVEKSPLLPATLEDAEKLTALGEKASAAADDGDLVEVLKLGREGAAIRGRCDERQVLDQAVGYAREYAESEFGRIERELQAGVEAKLLRKDLRALAKTFKHEPEAEVATEGAVAVVLYEEMVALADGATDRADQARAKGAERFNGTRWGPLFGAPGVKPDPPVDEDASDAAE